MANGRQRAGEGESHDDLLDTGWSGAGKRTRSELIQRKAAGTMPAEATPAAAPFGPIDAPPAPAAPDLDPAQSYLDSILAAPVQRSADGAGAAAGPDVHGLAAAGTAGPAGSLPFLDQIQASFGAHDVGGVAAHTDERAAGAAHGMGASAYAAGNHVAFAGTPDLHTAAHEAAHVVQQRGGVSVPGGVGQDGDAYEQHADRVADAVVRGESAEALLDHAGGGRAPDAVQFERKKEWGAGKPSKSDQADSDALLNAEAEDHFLDTVAYYLQWQHFRSGGTGPKQPRSQKNQAFHALAEQVRGAQLIFVSPSIPDKGHKGLDAWGAARIGVMQALTSANKRGSSHVDKAADGVGTADGYFAGRVVDEAIAEAEAGGNIGSPDAAFVAETQKAVDQATLDAMELMRSMPASAQGDLKEKVAAVHGMPFEAWYHLVQSTPNPDERLKKAKAQGIVVNSDTVADMLRGALYVVKGVVTAINGLASLLMPAAEVEAKAMFARLAKITGDATIKTFGEVLTKALGVIQIIAGAIGLVRGIASGNVKQALKGAQRIAAGGVSLGMLGVGAGLGATLAGAGLVMIFFGTLESIVDVGALLRDMKRQKTLQVTYEFIQQAAKIAVEARTFVATVEVMLDQANHSKDPTMQNEVEERVEQQAMEQGGKIAKKLQALGQEMWSDSKDSIGGYPDLRRALGSQTRTALDHLAIGINNEPLMVADACLYIFQGIDAMGQYAMKQYGKPI